MWETWIQSLGCEDTLEEGMTTHTSILAWRIPMDRGAWWATVHGVTKSQTRLSGRPGFDLWVRKSPLKKEMATHSCIHAWRIPIDRGAWQATVHRVTKSLT